MLTWVFAHCADAYTWIPQVRKKIYKVKVAPCMTTRLPNDRDRSLMYVLPIHCAGIMSICPLSYVGYLLHQSQIQANHPPFTFQWRSWSPRFLAGIYRLLPSWLSRNTIEQFTSRGESLQGTAFGRELKLYIHNWPELGERGGCKGWGLGLVEIEWHSTSLLPNWQKEQGLISAGKTDATSSRTLCCHSALLSVYYLQQIPVVHCGNPRLVSY